MFQTPILFLVFNRPELTEQVFQKIREIQPQYLFVAADGPRTNKPGEEEKTALVRQIATQVDWSCELKTLFRNENLGCGIAVSEAITWFFEQVEEGIILEDDCLPSTSFFHYCSELLWKYKNNEKIMHIGGCNFQNGVKWGDGDYYYSTIPHVWGWATWKRAWSKYDFNMKKFTPNHCLQVLKGYYNQKHIIDYWIKTFSIASTGAIDTWDYQWHFTILINHGISIAPNTNLISNIGFGINATHTTELNVLVSNLPIFDFEKFKKPSKYKVQKKADLYTFKTIYGIIRPKNWYEKLYLKNKIERIRTWLRL